MIRDWPLLLVRVGIVAAAATALARPVFVNTWRVARAMQRDVRAVIVDTSGSMGRRAAASQGALLDQARQRASVDVPTASASTVFEAVDGEVVRPELSSWNMQVGGAPSKLSITYGGAPTGPISVS